MDGENAYQQTHCISLVHHLFQMHFFTKKEQAFLLLAHISISLQEVKNSELTACIWLLPDCNHLLWSTFEARCCQHLKQSYCYNRVCCYTRLHKAIITMWEDFHEDSLPLLLTSKKTSTDTITLCSQHVAMIAAQTMNYFQCLAFLFLPAGPFSEMLAIDSASFQTIWLYPCPRPIPFSFLLKTWYQLPCCEFIAQQVWIHSTWMVNRKLKKKIRENNLVASR